MDVKIYLPTGSDISKIKATYPDIYLDDTDNDGDDVYFIDCESHDDAVEICGFIDGAMDEVETLIDGCGPWAMSEARQSDIYSNAFDRGTGSDVCA